MAKKRGLGRGLDALLGVSSGSESADNQSEESSREFGASLYLSVDLIQRGRFQPRRHFDQDSLQELADSISAQGMVQPVAVRLIDSGKYELIAGERRWRAAQLAGISEIPAVIHEADDQAVMAMALIENIQRADLNPLEEAQALHRLLEEFGLTHQEVAQNVGKSRTTVTNLLRLLDLNPEVKALLDEGELEMGHARALLGLKDGLQTEAAAEVVKKGLSVRETESLVRRLASGSSHKDKRQVVEVDPNVKKLLSDLTDRLGARIQLQQKPGGKGALVINYNSLDELDGILEHIK